LEGLLLLAHGSSRVAFASETITNDAGGVCEIQLADGSTGKLVFARVHQVLGLLAGRPEIAALSLAERTRTPGT